MIDCVLSALIYLGIKNITHGDIKPSNILLTPNGIYKITDVNFMTGLNSYKKFLFGAVDDC